MTQLNKILSVTPSELNALDMSFHKGQPWFNLPAGKEHYRLLAYISSLYENETLLDIGSYLGDSAHALAYGDNDVYSYDVEERGNESHDRIRFRYGNFLEQKERVLKAPFILIDTYHNGDFEQEVVEGLDAIGYKGLVMWDDINLNGSMKEFWSSLDKEKYDLTHIGHHSGTGLVVW